MEAKSWEKDQRKKLFGSSPSQKPNRAIRRVTSRCQMRLNTYPSIQFGIAWPFSVLRWPLIKPQTIGGEAANLRVIETYWQIARFALRPLFAVCGHFFFLTKWSVNANKKSWREAGEWQNGYIMKGTLWNEDVNRISDFKGTKDLIATLSRGSEKRF